jgi:hypothetical protein
LKSAKIAKLKEEFCKEINLENFTSKINFINFYILSASCKMKRNFAKKLISKILSQKLISSTVYILSAVAKLKEILQRN